MAIMNEPFREDVDVVASYIHHLARDGRSEITTETVAAHFSRLDLIEIAWSFAVFGVYPPRLMELIYLGLFGSDKKQDPEHMCQVHSETGFEPDDARRILQIQGAMDLDGSIQGLVLPLDFPDGWIEAQRAPERRSLITSPFQHRVSRALTRIGFEHVVDHVVTVQDVSREGQSVPSTDMEILTISIADLKNHIAIEVDGPSRFVMDLNSTLDVVSKNSSEADALGVSWNARNVAMNGPTVLKHRMLEKLGWRVIHVPFWEWNALEGVDEAEEHYARHCLD